MKSANGAPAGERYTYINTGRVLTLLSATVLVWIYTSSVVFIACCAGFTVLAICWLIFESIREQKLALPPRSCYIPTSLDIAVLSFFVVFTGGLGSFVIGGYYYPIVVGSLNRRIDQGFFALVVSTLALTAVGILSHLGLLPNYAILDLGRDLGLTSMTFIFLLWLIIGVSLYRLSRTHGLKEQALTAQIAESEKRYRLIAENTHDIIWTLDLASRRYTYVSPSIQAVRGISVSEALAEPLEKSFVLESSGHIAQILESRLSSAAPDTGFYMQGRQPCSDGRVIDVEISATFIRDGSEEPREVLGITRDITQRLREQEQNETIQLLLRNFEDGTGDAIWELDSSGRFLKMPPRFPALFGKTEESLLHTQVTDAFLGTYKTASPADGRRLDKLAQRLAANRPFMEAIVRLGTNLGSRYWALDGKPILSGSGAVASWRIVSRDVTTTILESEELERQAYTDSLTGLPNLLMLRRIMSQVAQDILRRHMSVLVLVHIENLKTVNAILGHEAGDAILALTARRLRLIAETDGEVAARVAGADFACILRASRAEDIQAQIFPLFEPASWNGESVDVDIRAGAVFCSEAETPELLYLDAEAALNSARAKLTSTVQIFDAALASKSRRQHELYRELDRALERREFHIEYQPQVAPRDGAIRGFEALIRWENTRLGTVSPVEFIPLAERQGYILSFGAWIQSQACREALAWKEPWRVAVNISPAQLLNRNFDRSLLSILEAEQFPPERLKVEVTESALIQDLDRVTVQLAGLRKEGIHIALDDFGTGFSSLALLQNLPLDELKIDQSFVRRLGTGDVAIAILSAIAQLASSLGLETTAEGVETQEQARIIAELGCTSIQGYLSSRPVPQATILEWDLSTRLPV